MKVYMIGLNGIGLMPTTPGKARRLLKAGKAEVYQRHPFTIRLLYKTGCNTQPLSLGIDTGESHIGIAVVSQGRVLESVIDCSDTVYYRQVRKKKRSLHEATPRKGRKEPNRTARRNVKNIPFVGKFHIYDKVEFNEKKAFISGFTGKSAYIVDFNGKYIIELGRSYKQISLSKLKLLSISNNNYIVTTR